MKLPYHMYKQTFAEKSRRLNKEKIVRVDCKCARKNFSGRDGGILCVSARNRIRTLYSITISESARGIRRQTTENACTQQLLKQKSSQARAGRAHRLNLSIYLYIT